MLPVGAGLVLDAQFGGRLKVILSTDPIRYPLTGIGRYAYELGKHLGWHPCIERLRFLHGARLLDSLPEPSQAPTVLGGVRRHLPKSRLAVGLYQKLAPWLKSRALRGYEDHVHHGPNFYLPPFGGVAVVTMHDLSVVRCPDCHPPERVRFLCAEIEISLRRAAMLITVSEFTRQEVAVHFGWPLERVRAVPLASAAEFRPRAAEELLASLTRHGLSPEGYVLFVGTIEPRKNIPALLDAYAMLPDEHRRRWPLVIVGYRGWNSDPIHARMAQGERAGWLRYLGYVAAEDLSMLMAGARLFVFPSLYEGFGLPVLEAMASGVPVVCSNASSLPEVAGDAAAMCDPGDVDTLASLIAKGMEDEGWRVEARARGLAQSARFSWQRCARQTVDVYRAALQARGR